MPNPGSTDSLTRNKIRIGWFAAIAIVGLAAGALVLGRGFSLGVGGDSGPQLNVGDASIGRQVSAAELAEAQPELQS